ncbi:MAG: hypothetical protein WCZ98_01390 [Sideroxydans sp.]
MFDPITALAAFAPVLVKAGEALVQRFIAPDTVKPTNIAEVIELRRLDVEQFKILQEADSAGQAVPWVEAVRKLQRPLVVAVLLAAFVSNPTDEATTTLFSVAMFYLFGERTMIVRGKK